MNNDAAGWLKSLKVLSWITDAGFVVYGATTALHLIPRPLRELRRSEDGSVELVLRFLDLLISATGFSALALQRCPSAQRLDRVALRSSDFVGLDVLFGAASGRLLADRPRIRLGLVATDLVRAAVPTAVHRAFGQLDAQLPAIDKPRIR